MEAVILILAVALGLAFGSFLNVCIVRLPLHASLFTPRSHCMRCLVPIQPVDNIPVLSWLLLRGQCRACKNRISPQYPIVETATAILFVGCFLESGPTLAGLAFSVFSSLLLGLAIIDAKTFLLPDTLTITGVILGIAFNGQNADVTFEDIPASILGIAAIGGFLLLTRLLYRLVRKREGMGFGDVKLGAMVGAWLGWRVGGVALILAVVSAAIGGAVLVLLDQRRRRASAAIGQDAESPQPVRVPFGAFLAGAGIVAVFAGDPLLRWYLGLIYN